MGAPKDCNKITICRTFGEIEFLKHKLKSMGRDEIRSYIRSELKKIADNFNKKPESITPAFGGKMQLVYYVDDKELYQTLQQISFLLQRAVSPMVDDFIIAPLLKPEY